MKFYIKWIAGSNKVYNRSNTPALKTETFKIPKYIYNRIVDKKGLAKYITKEDLEWMEEIYFNEFNNTWIEVHAIVVYNIRRRVYKRLSPREISRRIMNYQYATNTYGIIDFFLILTDRESESNKYEPIDLKFPESSKYEKYFNLLETYKWKEN